MESQYAPLSEACAKTLWDKTYDKRKIAATEIEKYILITFEISNRSHSMNHNRFLSQNGHRIQHNEELQSNSKAYQCPGTRFGDLTR